MSTIDLPPHYTTALAHAHSLPLYTECPTAAERILHSVVSSPAASTSSHDLARRFVFTTDHLEIDLGEFPCALLHPAYGFNGVVEGIVKFRSKCTHVLQVTVKLEGIVATTASEHAKAAIAGYHTVTLFSKTVPVVAGRNPGAVQTVDVGSTYPFAVAFPTYIAGRSAPLPPSYTTIHAGVSSEIKYYIQVDVSRQGMFRRNEVRKIPVLFLPKTRPAMPPLYDFPCARPLALPERVKAIALAPAWSNAHKAQTVAQFADLPTVHLFIPAPLKYTSGDLIPLAVDITCASSPALTKLYASGVEVQLVKQRCIWLPQGRLVTTRETVVSNATFTGRQECNKGTAYLGFRLMAGVPGREVNVNVDGALDVHYFIRVTVRPPSDVKHLPAFRVDVPVQLTTDQYEEDPETDMLTVLRRVYYEADMIVDR